MTDHKFCSKPYVSYNPTRKHQRYSEEKTSCDNKPFVWSAGYNCIINSSMTTRQCRAKPVGIKCTDRLSALRAISMTP